LGLAWAIPAADRPAWLLEAKTAPLVERLAEFLRNMAPPEFRARVPATAGAGDPGLHPVQQYETILRAPSLPQATSSASTTERGYKADERRGLDGLIQRAQPFDTPAQANP